MCSKCVSVVSSVIVKHLKYIIKWLVCFLLIGFFLDYFKERYINIPSCCISLDSGRLSLNKLFSDLNEKRMYCFYYSQSHF